MPLMVRPRPHYLSPTDIRPATSVIGAAEFGAAASTIGHLAQSGVGQRIPGFNTSAAFLTSLSANLCITDDELLPSPVATPPSLRSTTADVPHLPPPSPLASAVMSSSSVDWTSASPPATLGSPPAAQSVTQSPPTASPAEGPLAGVPSLSTLPARSDDARRDALRLVADGVAQQRQTAARNLLAHPLNLGALGATLALVASWLYRGASGNLAILSTTWAGVIMAALVAVRWAVGGYVLLAEDVGWSWLDPGDDVLVTWFGDEAIAALVVRWAAVGEGKTRKRRGKRGMIRAWTVKLRYRGKGVGTALLEEAVLLANSKGAEGIDFDADNIYAKRFLPNTFNGVFDRRDDRALAALQDAVTTKGKFGRRRSKGSF